MNQTPNYQLNQWEADDKVQRTDFNADNARIDAALAGKGNCQIITGSYVGTGTVGEKGPNVIPFAKRPLIVFVYYNAYPMITIYGTQRGVSLSTNSYNKPFYTSWSGNTLSWYVNDSNAANQLNEAGMTYSYIAFLKA